MKIHADFDREAGRSRELYSDHYRNKGAAYRYDQKFQDRLERLRHIVESRLLRSLARGRVLDCSIATGRFVNDLQNADWLAGMDFSEEFLRWSALSFPEIPLVRCDLLQGIPLKTRSFDFVFCLRTLSSLGDISNVLSEMHRVTRPGGVMVFDYGTEHRDILIKGKPFTTDASDVDSILAELAPAEIKRLPFDGVLLWLKRSTLRKRLFDRILSSHLGDDLLIALEEKTVRWFNDRIVYVVKRAGKC